MGFLERFFSADGAHFAVLSIILVYFIKTERRLAKIEAACRLMCPFSITEKPKENGKNGH
jgi:hypothetical protein